MGEYISFMDFNFLKGKRSCVGERERGSGFKLFVAVGGVAGLKTSYTDQQSVRGGIS